MTDANETGQRVLDGFAKGRQRAIAIHQARAAELRRIVFDLAMLDRGPRRGLAGRIARKLGGRISESHARRILCTLYSVSDFSEYTSIANSNLKEN
jgi:hypothetical protein